MSSPRPKSQKQGRRKQKAAGDAEDRDLYQKSTNPFSKVNFNKKPRESLVKDACIKYPGIPVPKGNVNSNNQALLFAYTSRYMKEYGPSTVDPYAKALVPNQHESMPDRVTSRRRQYLASMETVHPTKGTAANDGDTGRHEWRQLLTRPGNYLWQKCERIPFYEYVGKRCTLPPVRVTPHDPHHEKERWNTIKALDATNNIAYGYRRNIPGYAGYRQLVEHVNSNVERDCLKENKSMESTMQATYREHPDDLYNHGQTENENKHKGPMSRMVTLTHPFNPFTQQSAYSNMGATHTTGNK